MKDSPTGWKLLASSQFSHQCAHWCRPFESFLPVYQKRGEAFASPLFWYTGRDSNPQPSEPESDALSIEPPVHLPISQVIITGLSLFVKRCFLLLSAPFPDNLGKRLFSRQSYDILQETNHFRGDFYGSYATLPFRTLRF